MNHNSIPYKEIHTRASFYSPESRKLNVITTEEIYKAAGIYLTGILADIGCGKKPYAPLLKPFVKKHIGIDHPGTLHGFEHIDVIGTVYNTALKANTCDSVLCSAVLEHVEEPEQAIREAFRILKPSGYAVYGVPFIYPVHEAPRDFYRYSLHGIQYLLTKTGFEIVSIKPLAGYFLTLAQFMSFGIGFFNKGIIRRSGIISFVLQTLQGIGYFLDKYIPHPE